MATSKHNTDDPGCIILVTPVGKARPRRLVIPAEVGQWLMDELGAALVELKIEAKARRHQAKVGGR